eukprot:7384932-Prymnesium_polylepis.1
MCARAARKPWKAQRFPFPLTWLLLRAQPRAKGPVVQDAGGDHAHRSRDGRQGAQGLRGGGWPAMCARLRPRLCPNRGAPPQLKPALADGRLDHNGDASVVLWEGDVHRSARWHCHREDSQAARRCCLLGPRTSRPGHPVRASIYGQAADAVGTHLKPAAGVSSCGAGCRQVLDRASGQQFRALPRRRTA